MKIRTQILIFLLLFALVPLLVTVATNLPRVLGILESFHRQLYLQGLRSDFRDLDQHLAARREMTKLLAKLPEPGAVMDRKDQDDNTSIDEARARYIGWINMILPDQLDIIEIMFLDQQGQVRFWLERDAEKHDWQPTLKTPVLPPSDLINQTLNLKRPEVLVSNVRIDVQALENDPRRTMNLRLLAPSGFVPGVGPTGVVVMSVDIGGMAQRFNNTFWAYDDGRYLELSKEAATGSYAFSDFPGLAEKFSSGKITLWEGGDGGQVIWVPLIYTESSGPVWVGRRVDATPLADFRSQLITRVSGIVLALMIIAWMLARWFAMRADHMGNQLTDNITRLLEDDEQVKFEWTWTEELRQLGNKLTALATKHARNSRRITQHTKELEESNRYKSEFLANVSHELRTPLNSILLLSKMLADRESKLPPEQAQQASVIHHAGKDLQALIDDILDISRIEARRSALNLENINLPELLDDLICLLEPQYQQKGLSLKLELVDDVPQQINSDPDKIRQIVKNFLANAVKFTEQGGVIISVTPVADEDQLALCISVKDTGIGIPADKQDVIFEAFKQADGSTNRRFGGTGLGLTISLQLAKLLGGRIELDSVEGQGSDFRLCLPLVFDRDRIEEEQVGVDEPAEDILQPQQQEETLLDFGGQRALVVDDDVRNLLALTPLLERWGLEVFGAGDAEEALEVLNEEEVHIILMDIMMPGTDGYATIKSIREDEATAQLPIVALTARADEFEKERCIKSGANDFIPKPIDTEELKRKLTQLLGQGEAE